MWSVDVTKAPYQTNDGNTVVEVLYTDGVSQKVLKTISLGVFELDAFKLLVQTQLDQYNKADAAPIKLPLGPFDPTIIPIPLTPEQLARRDYSDNLRLFGQMTRAIAAGVKKVSDKDYIDLQAKLVVDFIDSYIDLF